MKLNVRVFFIFKLTLFAFGQECNLDLANFKDDPMILSTLNGKIKGSCERITVNDPDIANLTGNVISWKCKKYIFSIISQLN